MAQELLRATHLTTHKCTGVGIRGIRGGHKPCRYAIALATSSIICTKPQQNSQMTGHTRIVVVPQACIPEIPELKTCELRSGQIVRSPSNGFRSVHALSCCWKQIETCTGLVLAGGSFGANWNCPMVAVLPQATLQKPFSVTTRLTKAVLGTQNSDGTHVIRLCWCSKSYFDENPNWWGGSLGAAVKKTKNRSPVTSEWVWRPLHIRHCRVRVLPRATDGSALKREAPRAPGAQGRAP